MKKWTSKNLRENVKYSPKLGRLVIPEIKLAFLAFCAFRALFAFCAFHALFAFLASDLLFLLFLLFHEVVEISIHE